jgi:hypothetical protein
VIKNYPTNMRVSLKDKTIYSLPFHERLRKDPELQHSFQCNIAMAFHDCALWYKKRTGAKYLSQDDLYKIGNEAAKNFIKLWTSE